MQVRPASVVPQGPMAQRSRSRVGRSTTHPHKPARTILSVAERPPAETQTPSTMNQPPVPTAHPARTLRAPLPPNEQATPADSPSRAGSRPRRAGAIGRTPTAFRGHAPTTSTGGFAVVLMTAVILAWTTAAGAAPARPRVAVERARADLESRLGRRVELHARRGTGTASMVAVSDGGDLDPTGARLTTRGRVERFLERNGALFGLSDARAELAPRASHTDDLGWTQISFMQHHRGIEVFGAELRGHLGPDGALRRVAGVSVTVPSDLSTDTVLTKTEAEARAAAAVAAARKGEAGAAAPEGASRGLVVFATGLLRGVAGPVRLDWAVEVSPGATSGAAEGTFRDLVLVDASDGTVHERIPLVHDALQRTVRQASYSNLIWSEGNPDPITAGWASAGATTIAGWQDEIDGAREAYGIFGSVNRGGWRSFDGADAAMHTVHDSPAIDCPNAQWNGWNTAYCTGVTSDDIVAHEWGHALTQHTAGLIYQWQAGALNESYSDIWGEAVDLLNGRGTDAPASPRAAEGGACSSLDTRADPSRPATDASLRWLIGEDSTAFGGPIRDLWTPECHHDPGHVTSESYYCDSSDNGGVHSNSGVPNHLFALLVDGGTSQGHVIAPLGLDAATALLARALRVYETSATDFAAHADALEASCTDLTGQTIGAAATGAPASWADSAEVIDAGDCASLAEAIAAVGLRDEAPCVWEPILATNPPALCSSGTADALLAEDFEGTPTGWTLTTRAVVDPADFAGSFSVMNNLPDGRTGHAAFALDFTGGNCDSNDQSGVMVLESPAITLSAEGDPAQLAFDHWLATETDWDGANVKISVDGGPFTLIADSAFVFNGYNDTLNSSAQDNTNPLASEPAWTGTNGGSFDGSWGRSIVSLAGLASAGQTIRLRFELGVDGCSGNTGWYIDDVMVYECTEPPLEFACPAAPMDACLAPANPDARAKFSLSDSADDARDGLRWSLSKGAGFAAGDLGTPDDTTNYRLCVYDGRSGVPVLASEQAMPAGALWRSSPNGGWRFRDPTGLAAAGLISLTVAPGPEGASHLTLQGRGTALDLPAAVDASQRFGVDPEVTVQLLVEGGACIESRFGSADFSRNSTAVVRGLHRGP